MGVTLVSRIPAIQAGCEPKASRAVAKTVADVESGAKALAAVDTGQMRSEVNGVASGLTGEVAAEAAHSIFNEYGTYKMAAQPFMTPAAEAAFPGFVSAMKSIAT